MPVYRLKSTREIKREMHYACCLFSLIRTVYMGGGTGRLPGWDVFISGLHENVSDTGRFAKSA